MATTEFPDEIWLLLAKNEREAFIRQAWAWLMKLPSGEHMWCKHEDVACEVIQVLEHKYPQKMIDELSTCTDCVNAYSHSKFVAKQDLLTRCEVSSVENFFTILRGLDSKRLLTTTSAFDINDVTSVERILVACYEIMQDTTYLMQPELMDSFSEAMAEILESHPVPITQVLPGPFLLLFHPNMLIRGWADVIVTSYTQAEPGEGPTLDAVKPTWDLIISLLQDKCPEWPFLPVTSDEFWASLFGLLAASYMDGITKLLDTYNKKLFMDVILKKLNQLRRANDAFDILFSLLENMAHEFWSYTSMRPLGVFKVASVRIEQSFDNPLLQTTCCSLLLIFLQSIVEYGQHGDLKEIFIEVISFLANNIQNSILRKPPTIPDPDSPAPKYSLEVKAVAKSTCLNALRLWYLNFQTSSEDSVADVMRNPLVPLHVKWGPVVVDCALALVNSAHLSREEAQEEQKMAIELVKQVLSLDKQAIQAVCRGLLNNGQMDDEPLILWKPSDIQLCTAVWECLAVNGDRLPSELHMSMLGNLSELVYWDLDHSCVLNLPEELKKMQTRMYEVLFWARETIIGPYFDSIRKVGINSTSISTRSIVSASFPLMACGGHKIRSSLVESLKTFLVLPNGSSIDDMLRKIVEGPHVRSFLLSIALVLQEAEQVIPDGMFKSWEWTLFYLGKIFSSCGVAFAAAAQQFQLDLQSLGVKSIWHLIWGFLSNTILLNAQQFSSRGPSYTTTMIRFFDCFGLLFAQFSGQKLVRTALERHPQWFDIYFHWFGATKDAKDLRRRWLGSFVEIVQSMTNLGVPLEETYVAHLKEMVQRGELLPSDELTKLSKLVPGIGVIAPTGLSSLFNLPSSRVQSKLPFSPADTPTKTKVSSTGVIEIEDDSDEEPEPVVAAAPNNKYFALFNRPFSEEIKTQYKLAVYEPKKPQQRKLPFTRSGSDKTLDVLRGFAEENDRARHHSSTTGPAVPKAAPAPRRTAASKLIHDMRKQAAALVPKAPMVIDKGKTVEDRRKELEMQRAAAAAARQGLAADKLSKKVQVLAETGESIAAKLNEKEARRVRRQRLAPSLNDLLKRVFAWDFNDINDNQQKNKNSFVHERVPSRFRDEDHYIDIFEPLLLEEFRAQLERGRQEETDMPVSMKVVEMSDADDFRSIMFGTKNHPFGPSDLVLLYRPAPGRATVFNEEGAIGMIPEPYIFGMVEKQTGVSAHSKFHPSRNVKIKTCLKGNDKRHSLARTALAVSAEWHIKKVVNMSTMIREWQALQSLPLLPFRHLILNPMPSKALTKDVSAVPLVEKMAESKMYNDVQLQAIVQSSSVGEGINLIRGPPGTGKTKTILGIISGVLDRSKGPVLICAPSNAAVDEIVARILDVGLYTLHRHRPDRAGDHYMYNDMNEIATWRPNVVRVAPGASGKKLRKDIEQVSLDRLVQQKFDDANKDRERAKVAELQAEIESGPPRDVPIAQKPQPLNRKMVKQSILASADIICTTLSTSGRGMFRKVKFETVIIDEAGQAVELSLLIPLKYDCKRFIMVGDPQQLPATVISQVAMSYQYEQSLFARMMKCGYPSLTLTTQYRMHPMIREFPSKHFYDDQLIDGVDEVTRARPWHSLGKSFAPFVFFDIQQGHQLIGTHQSFVNPTEAEFVTGMFQLLQSKFPDINDLPSRIGIITPYQQQRARLARDFERILGFGDRDQLDINTVDGYQGKEKEIIMLSTVRSHEGRGVGFLADIRRMNVALTRAKCSMWIVGNSRSLIQNSHWRELIDFAKEIHQYIVVPNVSTFLSDVRSHSAAYSPVIHRAAKRTTMEDLPVMAPQPRVEDESIEEVPSKRAKLSEVLVSTNNSDRAVARQVNTLRPTAPAGSTITRAASPPAQPAVPAQQTIKKRESEGAAKASPTPSAAPARQLPPERPRPTAPPTRPVQTEFASYTQSRLSDNPFYSDIAPDRVKVAVQPPAPRPAPTTYRKPGEKPGAPTNPKLTSPAPPPRVQQLPPKQPAPGPKKAAPAPAPSKTKAPAPIALLDSLLSDISKSKPPKR